MLIILIVIIPIKHRFSLLKLLHKRFQHLLITIIRKPLQFSFRNLNPTLALIIILLLSSLLRQQNRICNIQPKKRLQHLIFLLKIVNILILIIKPRV